MKNRKIIAGALATALCCASVGAYADEYDDMLEHFRTERAETAITQLSEKNIFLGTENGPEPNREVSRAEALTLALRCYGIKAPRTDNAPFDDVPLSHWACDTAAYAKSQKWVDGTGNNLFEPNRTVSGKEFCKMLLTVRGDTDININDVADLALSSGLLLFSSEQTLISKNALTRADTALLCCNALNINAVPQESMTPSFAQKLAELTPDDENYCISPYSLKTALAMTVNGATGDSQTELLNLLDIDDLDAFNQQAKEQTARYAGDTKLMLETANSIWLNQTDSFGNQFSKDFEKTIADYYGGEARTSNQDHIVDDVNSWVNEKTHEKIPTLLSPEHNQNAAYLVNAVYFLGEWQSPFEAERTNDDTFHMRSGEEKTIPFMHDVKNVRYYGDSHTQMIALPYKTDDKTNSFSMYIAMTDGSRPLEDYISQMTSQSVNIALPKFKTEYTQDFTGTLNTLGLKKCMEFSEDFAPMFDPATVPFKIDKVLQKTYLAVDENGTEAAAATAVMVAGTAAIMDRPISIPFIADKPFTYFIYDETAQEILFMGEYAF